jgi:energy-coupling factor transporter ATP-binding protein EcfA2
MDVSQELYELVFDRVADDPTLSTRVQELVLAAFTGDAGFNAALAGEAVELEPARRSRPTAVPEMYLSRIRVAGFRGIGPQRRLDLPPGPGLVLVTGRNGSGKSSFAEAAELTITGQNMRWAGHDNNRDQWQSGWRNLHTDGPTEIAVDVCTAGQPNPATISMSWADGAELDDRRWTVQQPPGRRADFDGSRWAAALELYRPFLSYNELGSLLDRKAITIYQELHRLLGLGAVDDALARLATARLERDKRAKAARDERAALRAAVGDIDDPRARNAAELLAATAPDLAALDALAHSGAGDPGSGLRACVELRLPTPVEVRDAIDRLLELDLAVTTGTDHESAAAVSVAELLERAVEHRRQHGDTPCPVCAAAPLDAAWQQRAEHDLDRLRRRSQELRDARENRRRAIGTVHSLISGVPPVLSAPPPGLDCDELLARWRQWLSLREETVPAALAEAVPRLHAQLTASLAEVRRVADEQLAQLDEVWRPAAHQLAAYVLAEAAAVAERPLLRDVKSAETWLKKTASALRDDRFAPIATRSQQVWEQLRQQSGVTVDGLRLQGAGNFRKMVLDVSVDGTQATAFGVMSQGELHSLALSLFLPRATMEASPFRFLVIDDPVQAMDPTKVDGLARTLAGFARTRQVVVFSHDDRLAGTARRLGLNATILEVTRLERSQVQIRPSSDPVLRYLADARALARAQGLPELVQRDLVSINCRNALDSAAIRLIEATRFAAGASHTEVDELLENLKGTRTLLAVALFGSVDRRDDVAGYFSRKYRWAPDALDACIRAGHGGYRGDLRTLVDRADNLVAMVRR